MKKKTIKVYSRSTSFMRTYEIVVNLGRSCHLTNYTAKQNLESCRFKNYPFVGARKSLTYKIRHLFCALGCHRLQPLYENHDDKLPTAKVQSLERWLYTFVIKFWYISFPSSAKKEQYEITKFCVFQKFSIGVTPTAWLLPLRKIPIANGRAWNRAAISKWYLPVQIKSLFPARGACMRF